MNKYNDGAKAQWFRAMVQAGWRFWIWQDKDVMWRHADEYSAAIMVDEAEDMFKYYVDHVGEAASPIPDPYEVLGVCGVR